MVRACVNTGSCAGRQLLLSAAPVTQSEMAGDGAVWPLRTHPRRRRHQPPSEEPEAEGTLLTCLCLQADICGSQRL